MKIHIGKLATWPNGANTLGGLVRITWRYTYILAYFDHST